MAFLNEDSQEIPERFVMGGPPKNNPNRKMRRETLSFHSVNHLSPLIEREDFHPLVINPNESSHPPSLYSTQLSVTTPTHRSSVQLRKLSFRRSSVNEISPSGNRVTLLGKPIQPGTKTKHNPYCRFALVFACLVLSVLATIPNYSEFSSRILYWLEIVILILLTIELVLRVWSAGCRSRYQGFVGVLKFCKRPFCLIDIIVILSSFVVICAGSQGNMFATTAMRSLRFLQILRMVRMDRRGGTWKLLSSVVMAHSKELLTAWYIGFLTLIFASFLVFQAEKETNEAHFGTYADALWWGLITLTTIGYGDKVPKTWVGRLIASFFAILGISFFALPAGILGSGFALKVQEQHRQKHFARRRMPAAYLIQCMWRCYAADRNSRSVATWLPHLRARLNKKKIKDAMHNNSNSPKLSRKSTFRHRFGTKSSVSSGNIALNGGISPTGTASYRGEVKNEVTKSQSLAERLSDRLIRQNSVLRLPKKKLADSADAGPQADEYDDYSSASSNSDSNDTVLTEQHKAAVRSIRMMKFLVARSKFKEALRPYDVKDVIEQYSSGHVEMLARIKNLQNRVDMILGINSDTAVGNPPSYYYRSIRTANDHGHCHNTHTKSNSMNSRLLKVETDVESVDRKLEMILDLLSNKHNSTTSTASRKTRKNVGKKESLSDHPPSPLRLAEHHNRSGDECSPGHGKEITGVEVNQAQQSPSASVKKQSRTKAFRESECGEIIELLPASAWESSINENNSLEPDEMKETSHLDDRRRDNLQQNSDFSDCDFTSMGSCRLSENDKTSLNLSNNSDSDDHSFAPSSSHDIRNPTTSSFNWRCSPSTYDNVHHQDASDCEMRSATDHESCSFKGVEDYDFTSIQNDQIDKASSDYIPHPIWSDKSVNERLDNKQDKSVIINLHDLELNSSSLSDLNVPTKLARNVPNLNQENSKSNDELVSCGDNNRQSLSTTKSNHGSPTFLSNNCSTNRPNSSQNKSSKNYPSSSTLGVAGDNIPMSAIHNSSLDKRCSLPLNQLSEFSTSSEVV